MAMERVQGCGKGSIINIVFPGFAPGAWKTGLPRGGQRGGSRHLGEEGGDGLVEAVALLQEDGGVFGVVHHGGDPFHGEDVVHLPLEGFPQGDVAPGGGFPEGLEEEECAVVLGALPEEFRADGGEEAQGVVGIEEEAVSGFLQGGGLPVVSIEELPAVGAPEETDVDVVFPLAEELDPLGGSRGRRD